MCDLTGLTLVIVSFGLLAGCRAPETPSGPPCAGAWFTDSHGGLHCAIDQVASPTFGIADLFGACPAIPLDAGSSSIQATVQATSNTTGGDPTCDDWGCGTNSATVGDGVVFDGLDSAGIMPGQHGVKIVSATRYRVTVQLKVTGDRLSVSDSAGHTYTGGQVVGTIIVISSQVGNRELRHELLIERFDDRNPDPNNHPEYVPLRFWAGEPDVIPVYRILTRPFGDHCPFRVPLCKLHLPAHDPSIEPAVPEWIEHSAIVFEGDLYDTVAKTVSDSSGSTWFNLACAGTAPAKMHLVRHTNAGSKSSSGASYSTTTDQRTAMLKMFTADYCGAGTPLTFDGHLLSYGDAAHWYPYTPSIGSDGSVSPSVSSIEALWTAHGAACLDTPRMATSPDTRDQIDALIDQACRGHRPPPCNGAVGVEGWEDGRFPDVHVISANPVLSPDAGAP